MTYAIYNEAGDVFVHPEDIFDCIDSNTFDRREDADEAFELVSDAYLNDSLILVHLTEAKL